MEEEEAEEEDEDETDRQFQQPQLDERARQCSLTATSRKELHYSVWAPPEKILLLLQGIILLCLCIPDILISSQFSLLLS